MNMNEIAQMELGLAGKTGRGRSRKKARAQWWFSQMRRVVDAAMEWKPAPDARPEQVYLSLSGKRSSV
jgi:hypothetical protein